jgi:hypothetical protein
VRDEPGRVGPAEARQRRAGDGAPALRGAVEALIDGQPVSWDLAEAHSRTPLEQQMTRQVRALATITASPVSGEASLARLHTRVASWVRACVHVTVSGAIAALRGTDAAALAALSADVHRARSPREVAAALMAHVPPAIGSPLVAVVSCDRGRWSSLAGACPALPDDAAITSLLASAGPVIRLDAEAAVFPLLPERDRLWLTAAGVATVVPLASTDGQPLGALLVGPRADGRPHTPHDRSCLAAAANMAALALGAFAGHGDPVPAEHLAEHEDLSFECEACGRVAEQSGRCACGGRRRLAALPALLHGAFEVQRRIGHGGMGVVYLARDLRLDRCVALKTLPCLSSGLVESIRAEARAMAALDHPQVAVLYGLEDWRGTPVLVAEYLPGGTLASRLSEGPIAVRDALAMGASIADALGALHERGWLHRDVKPSNIGFGRGGNPKLLDFGLTRWRQAQNADAPGLGGRTPDDSGAGALSGTPLYLSPDALDGELPGEHDDVWALSVVIVEMIAGAHPFRAATGEGVLALVRRRQLVDLRTFASGMPSPVADLLTRALHPSRSQRIAKARELAAALRALDLAS